MYFYVLLYFRFVVMKNILYIIKVMMISSLLLSCNGYKDDQSNPMSKTVSYGLSISAMSLNDPMAILGDNTFSSLAIYVFNSDASNSLDRHALLPTFSPVSSRDIPITSTIGTKNVYVIANYSGKTLKLRDGTPITLSPSTTKAQLDNLMVESPSGLASNSLLMVGKSTIQLQPSNAGATTTIYLRRLQARIDVHVFKGTNFGSTNVTIESIELCNQALNSLVEFDYLLSTTSMLPSTIFNNHLIPLSNKVVQPYSPSVVLAPSNADAIFYSYQNLVSVFSPVQVTAPYLNINVVYNGIHKTFKGYITDIHQLSSKYSLVQNNVYQVLAKIDIDSRMDLSLTILPWNTLTTEHKRPIVSSDFNFAAWPSSWGGLNGKTIYNVPGILEDAVFGFELKTPINASWTASLTNGLDFGFVSSTSGLATPTVSSASANSGVTYYIAIRPTKAWVGSSRSTEFYITVDGNEVPINPIVGSSRLYEGTDTRILIKQVASY